MKKLNWFEKFLFFLNTLFAIFLLFAYVLPYIPPRTFDLLSVLSLGVPLLIMVNVIFFLYWLFRLKLHVLLSFAVLLIGKDHLTSIYEVSAKPASTEQGNPLSVMSYNVRQFNQYGWSEEEDIPEGIARFVAKEVPDVLSMQEYYKGEGLIAEQFPYDHIVLKEPNAEFGLAIFSRFPIIGQGDLDFPTRSNNNAIYADIVKGGDTIRVINVHLQSFSVKPDIENLEQEQSKKVFLGMGRTFVKQDRQMRMVLDLIKKSPYRVLVMGDFNNTAYSYIYRELKSTGLYDAFKKAGNGFGKTFEFEFFPLRIDFILVDNSLGIRGFTNHRVPYSDHYPVQAKLDLSPL